jgi:hypothetical protein
VNTSVLKDAARAFLEQYPGGFSHPEMVEIGKKHNVERSAALAKESFAKACFDDPDFIVQEASRLVGRSSMVSMFEKPRFRDMTRSLQVGDRELLSAALYQLLHGKERMGFERLVTLLQKNKLAKWPIATIVQSYYRPQRDVFVKPTTARLIIEKLGLGLEYSPTPTWAFYDAYRSAINDMKTKVSKSLSPNNPAFCGFLMMTLR